MSQPTRSRLSQVADRGPLDIAQVAPLVILGSNAAHARCNLAKLPLPFQIQTAYKRIGATEQFTMGSKKGSGWRKR